MAALKAQRLCAFALLCAGAVRLAMPCVATHVLPCHATSCHAMPCHAVWPAKAVHTNKRAPLLPRLLQRLHPHDHLLD